MDRERPHRRRDELHLAGRGPRRARPRRPLAAEDSADHRPRCRQRLCHLPAPTHRLGLHVQPAPDRAGRLLDRARGRGRRHQLDLRADGRHVARRPLGPHHGRRGRGRAPGIRRSGRPRRRLPSRRPRDLRQALRRLRSGRGRARLQQRLDSRLAALGLPDSAVQGGHRRRRLYRHDLAQRHERRRLYRRPAADHRHPQAPPRLPRLRRLRFRFGARTDEPWDGRRPRRSRPQGLPRRRRHGHDVGRL